MKKNKLEENRKIIFFLNKVYHLIFSEKFSKKIKFHFDKRMRLDLIKYAIKKNDYKKYLEIGCHNNQIFDEIDIEKIGVDPVSGGNFRGTSDKFFQENKLKFDCIFIDGLHEYSQVKRDIVNSIQILNTKGVIILHDCLPASINHQRVPRTRYRWNGDVWKAIVEARTWDYINTYTVLSDQGLGVIKKEKNSDILNISSSSFEKLKYKFFYENYKKIMRTITYNKILEII